MADGFIDAADMQHNSENNFTATMASNQTRTTTLGREDGDYMIVDENSNHSSRGSSRVSDRPVPYVSPVDYAPDYAY